MTDALAAIRGHPRHLLVASVAMGLALASWTDGLVLAAAIVAGTATLVLRVGPAIAVCVCALAILCAALGAVRLAAIDADPLARAGGDQEVELRGFLLEHPRQRRFGSVMRVRASVGGGESQTIEVRAFAPLAGDPRIGDEIAARGKLSFVGAGVANASPEARSYARYLLRNGVRRRLQAKQIALTGGRRTGAVGLIDSIRARSERALASGLAPEPAALLRGMVLGGDNGLPEQTSEDFRVAGLSHILAVSGQNVLLIVILVQAIATAAGLPRRWRLAIPALLICIYVPLCGAQASVLRAGAMGLAGLAAIAASRPSSRLYALLLAAVFVLAWNPRATADVGAQLSFAAVLGIMAFTAPIARRFTRVPRWAAEAFAATAGATLATTPLMALHFGTFSVVSLAANVLGEPMIGPIVWLGTLAAAIGQLSAPLGALLNAPNGFLLGALIELAHFAASLPGAQVGTSRFGPTAMAFSFLAIALVAAWLNGWWTPPRAVRPLASRLRTCRRPVIALACGACLALGAAGLRATTPDRPPRPSIVFLDVGQGDATLLLGARGCNALIDGGPPGAGLGDKLERLGVRRLDLVLVTHPQLDHDGGLAELARAGRPRVVGFFDGGGPAGDPMIAAIRSEFGRGGVRQTAAVAGAEWRCGDLSLRVVAPASLEPGPLPPADPNERAAVSEIRVGPITMLASGDAESPQLAPLQLAGVDVLKVPHHGSADPGLPALLARLRPRIAVIEVGKSNSYGHPTSQALDALGASGAAVFRTDRDGDVLVHAANPLTIEGRPMD